MPFFHKKNSAPEADSSTPVSRKKKSTPKTDPSRPLFYKKRAASKTNPSAPVVPFFRKKKSGSKVAPAKSVEQNNALQQNEASQQYETLPKRKIVLTGGGTAGHVTPNIALLPSLREAGYEIAYVGSEDGIEKELMLDCGVSYIGVPTGKLRRYFDLKNFTDPFRVIKGFSEARKFLKSYRPDVVFSKGGFVSVPVVRAAASLRIPCVIHESDMTPGLANKLCYSAAAKICCNFPETMEKLPGKKAVLTGTPIRAELFSGDREEGLRICGFAKDTGISTSEASTASTDSAENVPGIVPEIIPDIVPEIAPEIAPDIVPDTGKPVLMIMGGSQGAQSVNEAVRKHLDELLRDFRVIHLCGAGKYDASLDNVEGYRQFEYVKDDLKHLFAAADVIVSRAGANAIFEILALQKPNLLIPLSVGTRGDQILNARSFEAQGFSKVLVESEEEGVLDKKLVSTVRALYSEREKYIAVMAGAGQQNAIPTILDLLNGLAGQ
ncbi:undecaprenyldiphospho-muramoylpentapeptide beta-N-acetylglucosaminyltransferase [Sarcina sp. DSM 11001]|uniref:glycosyltransferase n=1 Tax=Sarcina sp. DSM 11001 TaxID=1798184 RepID=UPI000882C728|nr:glycosyltransferase [Sarcina sp. DSM 11001]SDK83438.1 undecaprenyldiphospho-muramoylpentapeptide beta-N-acetylglucosaminyltransferase [Sarcina sp. DSM 11001]